MEGLLSKVYDAKWIIFGLILILVLLWVAWPFVNVLFYAIFLYYATRPLKMRLKPYIKNETLLVTTCMFLLVLPILLVVSYTLLLAVAQFNGVVQSVGLQSLQSGPLANMSTVVSDIQQSISINDIKSGNFSSIVSQSWYQTLSGYSGSISGVQGILLSTGTTIISLIFKVFLMIVIAFYMLREDNRLALWFKSTFPSLVMERDGLLVRYTKAVDNDLQKIFFGNILSIVVFAFLAVILFTLLNTFSPDPTLSIPSPILLGILCGVSALLPLIGMFVDHGAPVHLHPDTGAHGRNAHGEPGLFCPDDRSRTTLPPGAPRIFHRPHDGSQPGQYRSADVRLHPGPHRLWHRGDLHRRHCPGTAHAIFQDHSAAAGKG